MAVEKTLMLDQGENSTTTNEGSTAQQESVRGVSVSTFSPGFFAQLVGVGDGVIIALASIALYFGYVGWSAETYPIYLAALITDVALTLSLLHFADLYRLQAIVSSPRQYHKIIFVCAGAFFTLVALAFALKISDLFSRVWVFSCFFTSTALICLFRSLCAFAIKELGRTGRLTRNLAIVGGEEQGKHLLAFLSTHDEPWRHFIGVFDDRADRIGDNVDGHPLLGTLDDLVDYARKKRIDDIVIAFPWNADQRLMEIINKLKEMPISIYLGMDLIGYRFPHLFRSSIGNIPVIEVHTKPLSGWRAVIKALEDYIIASLLIFMLSPLLLIICAAIKLESKGPVIFRQARYGFNNQTITVLKFRSMYHGRPPEKGVPQAQRVDLRVTRVGKFLRRTSLDELPQLLNVLNGTMSLVGPRPHAVEHNEQYAAIIGGYFGRHKVKPGITGWAQVNGLRGETKTPDKMEARVEYDVYYIDNWSLWFDLKILFKTPYVVFLQKTAY